MLKVITRRSPSPWELVEASGAEEGRREEEEAHASEVAKHRAARSRRTGM
jgi:hypothetical protein